MLVIFTIHALYKTAKQNNFHEISTAKKVKHLKSITFLELLNCKKKSQTPIVEMLTGVHSKSFARFSAKFCSKDLLWGC